VLIPLINIKKPNLICYGQKLGDKSGQVGDRKHYNYLTLIVILRWVALGGNDGELKGQFQCTPMPHGNDAIWVQFE
jgi:hypothetical protein